jgi:hypothetical protein
MDLDRRRGRGDRGARSGLPDPETPYVRRALAAATLVAAILAPGAGAHYGTGKLGYRSTITEVEPRMVGLRFKILYGDDQVWLDNRSGKTVVIKGYSGEPYLRFSPRGIFVNIKSPSGYLNEDRYARAQVPKSANAKAAPQWEKLAGGDSWAWHDHRIHYMSPTPPPQIKDAPRKPHHVFDWKVPATDNGKKFFIAGSLDYKPPPPPKDFPYGLVISLAALVGAGMIGLFALRRVLIRSLD